MGWPEGSGDQNQWRPDMAADIRTERINRHSGPISAVDDSETGPRKLQVLDVSVYPLSTSIMAACFWNKISLFPWCQLHRVVVKCNFVSHDLIRIRSESCAAADVLDTAPQDNSKCSCLLLLLLLLVPVLALSRSERQCKALLSCTSIPASAYLNCGKSPPCSFRKRWG